MVATGFLVATLLAALAQAFPILETRQLAVSTLSATEVSGFKPYSFYAAAAYCKPTANLAWTCGSTSYSIFGGRTELMISSVSRQLQSEPHLQTYRVGR